MVRVKAATYNVHGWVDSEDESNLNRVADIVNQHDPDIICLQEVYPCWEQPCLLEFMRKTKFEHCLRWEGCAILSKNKLQLSEYGGGEGSGLSSEEYVRDSGGNYHCLLPPAPGYSFNRPRYVTAAVSHESQPKDSLFYLSCIHLVPKYSELRYEEVARIAKDLKPLFEGNLPQLWMGDFNSLNMHDYTTEEWEEIVQVRKKNGRTAPLNDVMEGMYSLGFSDNWTKAGKPAPRTTSRFNTRVDYVFSNKLFREDWNLKSFLHFPNTASDHSFVMAEFDLAGRS